MAAALQRFWQRLWRRRRPSPLRVELDVVEQWMLLVLFRSAEAPASVLAEEARTQRGTATEAQIRVALTRLESLGLTARGSRPAGGGPDVATTARSYRLTPRGRRLRRVVPAEPRSGLRVHL